MNLYVAHGGYEGLGTLMMLIGIVAILFGSFFGMVAKSYVYFAIVKKHTFKRSWIIAGAEVVVCLILLFRYLSVYGDIRPSIFDTALFASVNIAAVITKEMNKLEIVRNVVISIFLTPITPGCIYLILILVPLF